MSYICECGSATCTSRLRIGEKEYARLARAGAVLDPWCAVREGRAVIDRVPGRAVAVNAHVVTLVARMRGGRQWPLRA